MDFYADVLDHMGKTPREFGDVHVHLDEIARAPGGARAVASVLLQGAFEPMSGSARLRFFAAGAGDLDAPVGQFEAPPLRDGVVVRARYPLALPAASTQVFLLVEASVANDAERVRPAWKLFDTIEIPKLSEMTPVLPNVELNVADSVLHSALSGGLVLSFRTDAPVGKAKKAVVHKARELPRGLSAAIVEKDVAMLDAPAIEELWKPGRPLPDAVATPVWQNADTAKHVPPASTTRRCTQCGFEGKRADYASDRFCPICSSAWD